MATTAVQTAAESTTLASNESELMMITYDNSARGGLIDTHTLRESMMRRYHELNDGCLHEIFFALPSLLVSIQVDYGLV